MSDTRYGRNILSTTLKDHSEEPDGFSIGSLLLDLLRILILAAGLSGIVLILSDFPDIYFNRRLIIGIIFAALFAMFMLYRLSRLLFAAISVIGGIFFIRQGYLSWDRLLYQFNHIYDWFMAIITDEDCDLTELMIFSSLLACFMIFLLDVVLRYHLPTYVFVTAAFLLPPFFGAPLSYSELFILGAFQFFFLADSKAGRGLGLGFYSSRKRSAIAAKSSLFALALFGLSLLIATPLSPKTEGRLFTASLKLEERIADAIDTSFSNDEGVINRGSNTHTGEVLFTAYASREPGESIYLIRYRGGDYDGSRWSPIDEGDFFRDVASIYETDEKSVSSIYTTLYFQWNYVGVSGVDPFVRQLLLSSEETKYVAMRPYFGIRPDALSEGEEGDYSTSYYYYEERELVPLSDEVERGWSGMVLFADIYETYAKEKYTAYPEKQLPRLTELVRETPLTDLDEITSYIAYVLGSNAKYTTRPGLAPFNRDIVENFLFNSGLGYCQHYASTAVLMYRMYGIPARYVTGFRLDPDDFTSLGGTTLTFGSPDGPEYHGYADVPDSAAHAWVEIYISGYGWVPVDMTPTSSGDFNPTYPGFTSERMREIQAERGWTLNPESAVLEEEEEISQPVPDANDNEQEDITPVAADTDIPPTADEEASGTQESGQSPFPDLVQDIPMEEDSAQNTPSPIFNPDTLRRIGRTLIRVLIVLLIVSGAAGFILLYRRLQLRRNGALGVKELFLRFTDMLRFCGCNLPARKDDPALASVISEFMRDERGYSPVSTLQAEEIQRIVSAATFSGKVTSQEEDAYFREIYGECALALYEKLGFFKRLLFRFIKVYI